MNDDTEFKNMYKMSCRLDDLWWECHDKKDFSRMHKIAKNVHVDRLSCGLIISLLTSMCAGQVGAKELGEDYEDLANRCLVHLNNTNQNEEGLLTGLVQGE